MKQFITKLIYFIIPLILWGIIEAFLPLSTFAYRPWEALAFHTKLGVNKQFYPNATIKMNAVGDLAHHTEYEVEHYENWITDELGYRNDSLIKEPDIVIIGDSFIVGSGLEQDSTLTNLLSKKFDNRLKIYNISPATFKQFDNLINSDVIKKPKMVIYSIVERFVPDPLVPYNNNWKTSLRNSVNQIFNTSNINVFIDRSIRFFSIKWLSARAKQSVGMGVMGTQSSNMLFFGGINQKYDDKDLIPSLENLKSYKKYCDSLGMEFIFLPMPNKETVYYDYVPLPNQPDYLLKLDSMLLTEKINSLNILGVYNEYRQKFNNLLYHLDDTHWNTTGVNLISDSLYIKIREKF